MGMFYLRKKPLTYKNLWNNGPKHLQKILAKHARPAIRELEESLFQQENDPKHAENFSLISIA